MPPYIWLKRGKMTEKDTIFSSKVKNKKAIFDLGSLYDFCYTWLMDEGYVVTENTYSEKVAGSSKELEIIWTAEQEISDYFKFIIKIRWFIVGLKDVEVERGGEKTKLNKGDLELGVKGVLVKDYEGSWDKNAFYNFLKKVYNRYIIRGRIEQYEDKLFGDCDDFLAQVKAWLQLEGKH